MIVFVLGCCFLGRACHTQGRQQLCVDNATFSHIRLSRSGMKPAYRQVHFSEGEEYSLYCRLGGGGGGWGRGGGAVWSIARSW